MPDAIITSTASTFGTISGTFAADQSTITGTVTGGITGTISGSVGIPGPVGPAGPGSTWGGIAGVLSNQVDLWSELGSKYPASNPSGFITASALSPYLTTATANATFQTLAGMSSYLTTSAAAAGYYPLTGNPSGFLTSASLSGYATESWVTGQGYITSSALTPYLSKADNLASVASVSTARDNLGLGSLSNPTFAGVTVQGSGANVANLTPTSLSLTHATSGSFTIQPSVGITFPNGTVQTTAFTGSTPDYITSVSSPLSVTSGNLSVDLSAYLTTATATATYQTLAGMSDYLSKAGNLSGLASTSTARTNLGLGSLAVINDAPSDGSQYARKNGAWDVVTATSSYITSVSSPLSVTSGNLTIDLSPYAPLASPVFTGDARAVTAALGDNDTSIATTAFVQQELLSGTANARNLEVYVRNQTGSTIPAGSIVYINGATGNRPTITLAQANNDANSAQTFGFAKASIANNGFGFVIVRGELENIDTSALTEGVQLYLSPTTAGTWTTTKPSAPQHLVYVGICVRAHPTQGVVLVAVQNGYELNELHDVAIGTLANNDLLAYESSTDLWKNKTYSALGLLTSASAASIYAPLAGATFSGIVAFNGASANVAAKTPGYFKAYSSGAENTDYSLQYESGFAAFVGGTIVARIAASGILVPSGGITFSDATTQTTAGLSPATAASTYYPLTGNPSSFLVAADIAGKANTASPALTGNVTITTNSTSPALFIEQSGTGNILTLHDQASDTTFVAIDQSGKIGTIASTTANAGFNVPHGTAPTTPVNGDIWTTTSGLFHRQNGSTQQYVDFGGTQTISGAKTFSNANQTLGNSTAAGTINVGTGATISGATKAVNIGTSGVAGSTTNITVGSTTGTSTTTLQGITNGVTQSAGDSSLKLATTAFVTTADNLKANLASPALSGVPTAPTATAGTNTTQIATTAFVTAAVPAFATLMESRQFTNTTKAMSPRNVFWAIQSQDSISIRRPSFTYTTSGTIQYNQVGEVSNAIRLSTTAASSCFGRPFGPSQVDQVGALLFRENFSGNYLFGRALFLSGRAGIQGLADSTLTLAFYFGKAEGDAIGDLTRRGYGWKVVGGAGSRFISLEMHNGTTLTSTASSFAVTDNVCFDWDIYADGTGNVTLYINGSQVATVSGGPTNYNGYTPAWWREEFGSSATPTAAFPTAFFSRGKLTQLNFQ